MAWGIEKGWLAFLAACCRTFYGLDSYILLLVSA